MSARAAMYVTKKRIEDLYVVILAGKLKLAKNI